MSNQRVETIEKAVEAEFKRTTYPEGMPAIPGIPAARYSDQRFYDLEMQQFWQKTWLHVGHVSELKEPGAYKLFEQLGLSIIISRGAGDEIRAFHNICRHRGSALLLQPTGTARRFICPYHAWGYAGDGSLVSVPDAHDFACLKKEERGLMPVRIDTMRGMMFINLDGKAKPLAETHGPIERQIGDFPVEDMVVKGVAEFELDCNWKAAYDNFLEIYHVRTVHAHTLAPYLDWKTFSVTLFKNGHSRFVTRKRGTSVFGKESVGEQKPDDLFMNHTVALPTFPNCFTALDPVGFNWQSFWPAGPGKSKMMIYMMGWKGDGAEDTAFWEGMKTQIKGILAEDVELFASMQRSFDSGLFPELLLNWQERCIYWYQEEIDRIIGPENIPEDLRLKPVLGPLAVD